MSTLLDDYYEDDETGEEAEGVLGIAETLADMLGQVSEEAELEVEVDSEHILQVAVMTRVLVVVRKRRLGDSVLLGPNLRVCLQRGHVTVALEAQGAD